VLPQSQATAKRFSSTLGFIIRVPPGNPATSCLHYRKPAKPHIPTSPRVEIAGRRPGFRGLEIGIPTVLSCLPGQTSKSPGCGKVVVRVHSPCSRDLHSPGGRNYRGNSSCALPSLPGRASFSLMPPKNLLYWPRRHQSGARICRYSPVSSAVQFNRILALASSRRNSCSVKPRGRARVWVGCRKGPIP
jgi:hypothetical protein